MIVSERMNDMLERYGEVCPQIKAAQILSVSPRTIMRMADDSRLRRVGSHIDVRSICHYIENDQEMNFRARYRKKAKKKTSKSGASARSRKPPVDTSLPWANKF